MMLLHESMARAERHAAAMGGSFIVAVRYAGSGYRRDGMEKRLRGRMGEDDGAAGRFNETRCWDQRGSGKHQVCWPRCAKCGGSTWYNKKQVGGRGKIAKTLPARDIAISQGLRSPLR